MMLIDTMKPYIICHMVMSLDGRTDGAALRHVMPEGEYEATGSELQGDAWICGRTTMQQHFASEGLFIPASKKRSGPQPVFVARRAESYAVCVDTMGKLRWDSGDLDGDHLICVVSEATTKEYLEFLQERGISYVVVGSEEVDLTRAVSLLSEHFGIRTLLLEGGGLMNGSFLQAGLVDEVSILVVPGIDGRRAVHAIFDWTSPLQETAVPLKLKSVEKRAADSLWIRYGVVRP